MPSKNNLANSRTVREKVKSDQTSLHNLSFYITTALCHDKNYQMYQVSCKAVHFSL